MAIIYGSVDRQKSLSNKPLPKVKNIDDIDSVHQEIRKDIQEKLGHSLFPGVEKSSKKQQNKKSKQNIETSHANASRELQVIDVLSQLSDEYHILCDVNITLPNYVTYHGKKDLNSAQIDFVVISKKGIVLIDTKNKGSSPHDQVDRAARVLKSSLKSWRSPQSPKVKSVILSVKENIQYDPKYKSIMISDLDKINSFLQDRKEEFSDKELKRIFNRMKDHVTN